jgi:hypothetical protein
MPDEAGSAVVDHLATERRVDFPAGVCELAVMSADERFDCSILVGPIPVISIIRGKAGSFPEGFV